MKRIFTILLCLSCFAGFSQVYAPTKHIAVNDAIAPAQRTPIDARWQYYDTTLFLYRDFQSSSEVLSYLPTSTNRYGHPFSFIHSGGTLSSGIWTGGSTQLWWFKNGVADSNLVRIYTDSVNIPTNLIDSIWKINDSTFSFKELSGYVVSILIRGTAAGGISSLVLTTPTSLFISPVTFTNTGGAWSGTLSTPNQSAGTFFAGPSSGGLGQPAFRTIALADLPTGIPNGNLANPLINLSQDNTGTSPGWATTTVSMGGTALYHNPQASATTSGYLTSTDWNRFNSVVTGSVISVNGQTGVVVTLNADSLGSYPINFSNYRNGYVLAWDTVHGQFVFNNPATGTGISNLNGLTASTQSFAIGTSGTSPGISSVTATHTFNIPYVSGADSGLVTPALYNSWNAKQTALSGTGYLTFSGSTPTYLTPTQVTANLNLFTASLQGLTPLSGGGTTNFLRADGTWAAPPGGFANPMTAVGDIIIGGTSGSATRLGIGTNTYVLTSNGTTLSWQPPSGGGGTPANPTGTIGLTTVNGSLTTYMRSDAAPPLSQAIVPIWTGAHTFNGTVVLGSNTTFSADNTYSIGSGTAGAAHVWSRVFNSDGIASLSSATGNSANLSIGATAGITLLSTGEPQFNNMTGSGFTATANDSILTVDPATGNVHWRWGQPFYIQAVQGLGPLGTTGDSIGLGITPFYEPDTIKTAGFPFLITGLPTTTDTSTHKPVSMDGTGKLFQETYWPGSGGGSSLVLTTNATGVASTAPTLISGTLNIDTLAHKKIFNVKDFGAKGDGKRITDGAVSTGTPTQFTSASANFTSADVGKGIRIPKAGASGHDLVTTFSAFVNSMTMTLTTGVSASVAVDTCIYGTDNTTAIQNAIWADSLNGGGTVFFPNGFYCVWGPLVTSAFGGNPNSQIYFPIAPVAGPRFNQRTHYVIEGETPPNFLTYLFSDSLPPLTGSIIYSGIDGTGNVPAVFGTNSPSAYFNGISYHYFTFQNLGIMVAQNVHNGGPTMCPVNMYYAAGLATRNFQAYTDGNIYLSVKPTNECFGIVFPQTQSEIQSVCDNTQVVNFKYGLTVFDGTLVNTAYVLICQHALVLPHSTEDIQVSKLLANWNNNEVYVPASVIGGYIQPGNCHFNITSMMSEIWTTSVWYANQTALEDTSNSGVGNVCFDIYHATVGWDNTLFNVQGGANILINALGTAPTGTLAAVLTAGSVTTTYGGLGPVMQLTKGLAFQPLTATNAFITNNASYNGSTFTYDSTGGAGWLQFNGGSAVFRVAVAGTTGGTISPLTAMSLNSNLTGGIGGNGSFGSNTGYWINWNATGQLGFNNSSNANAGIVLPTGSSTISPLLWTAATPRSTLVAGQMQFNTGLWIVDSSSSKRDTFATRSWVLNNVSGGTSYTFSNGLTNTSGVITLGGSLTGNTTINEGVSSMTIGGTTGSQFNVIADMITLTQNSSSGLPIFFNGLIASGSGVNITSGTSSAAPTNASNIYFNPSSAIASYTLTLPSVNLEGSVCSIHFGGTLTSGTVVTLLTISPPIGTTIVGAAVTTGIVGPAIIYRLHGTVWYREQ